MKPGSYVTPTTDFQDSLKQGIKITPFIPIKNETICTVKEIIPCKSGGMGLILEEVTSEFNGVEMAFNPEFWREVETISSEEIFEMSKDAQENYSLVEKL